MVSNLPKLWKDKATIYIKESYIRDDKATGFRDVALCTDEPCKLSFFNNFKIGNIIDRIH